ncbi:Gfo/Idh/MocA family oxidoreductase [Bacillus sp. JCM 19041]|uniref:Gfo/Idh/MocA family oxidoreductase n=1 Tax=Bacillus sp. JCM 19041 TaxID=1460637 RepID=UPI0006D1CFCA
MKKVQVGFIGAGGIAKAHLKNVAANPHAKVVAIADISPQTVEAQSEIYGAKAIAMRMKCWITKE